MLQILKYFGAVNIYIIIIQLFNQGKVLLMTATANKSSYSFKKQLKVLFN